MARNNEKEYWTADLPKDHAALAELDAFCKDEGMISRTDATRQILIAWAKIRQGKDPSVWPGTIPRGTVPAPGPMPVQSNGQVRRPMLNGNAMNVELD